MFGVREDISLSFSISNEVLSHDPLLAEDLHGIKLVWLLLFNEVDLSKAATSEYFDGDEETGANFLLLEWLLLRHHLLAHYWLLGLYYHLILTVLQRRYLGDLKLLRGGVPLAWRVRYRCQFLLILDWYRVLGYYMNICLLEYVSAYLWPSSWEWHHRPEVASSD